MAKTYLPGNDDEGGVEAAAGKYKDATKGKKMWKDPRTILHMLFVEYRWFPLVYYMMYVLVITTVISIESKNQEASFMKLTACGGVAAFNKQHDAATTGRMWGSTKIKCTFTKCLSTGPCSAHTSANSVTGCLLTGTVTVGSEPFILNYILFAVIIPVYLGLVVYNLFFKTGGFAKVKGDENGKSATIATEEYINSLQSVQIMKWYKTYINVLRVVVFAVTIFGCVKGWQTGLNSLVLACFAGGIAAIKIIPSPRSIAPKKGKVKYDAEKMAESRKGLLSKFNAMVNFDSTTYAEESERQMKMAGTLEQAVGGWETTETYFDSFLGCFVCQ